jgi:transposase
VFTVKGEAGKIALDRWLSWARRCRIPAFVHLAQRITAIRGKIHATLDHGLSNALIESVNTKIRLLTRLAFGFRSADALIALAMLSLAGHRRRGVRGHGSGAAARRRDQGGGGDQRADRERAPAARSSGLTVACRCGDLR